MRGGIHKKGNNCYAVVYDGIDPGTGRKRRRWVPAGTRRADAERVLADLIRRKYDGEPVPTERLTVAQYLTERWLPVQRSRLRTSTYDSYRRNIDLHVVPAPGRRPLAKVTSEDARVDYRGLPSVVFTQPQLASAGLTEAEALAADHRCECRTPAFHDVPRALVNHDTRGAVKVVADADTGQVLGVHALADGAGEMMLAATYAIRSRMTVDDIADTWAPYLTMAESLRIAAGVFRNQTPTSCCA